MFEKKIKNEFLNTLKNVKYGQLSIETPEGEKLNFKGASPGVTSDIRLNDWRFVYNLNFKGDIGFAEDFRDGYIQTTDLTNLLLFGLQNESAFSQYMDSNFLYRQLSRLGYLAKRNTIKGSRKNIYKHYDLGNEFYGLWLDQTMTYSSAIFENDEDSLAVAQKNKYNRIIDKLSPSGDLLEVGCGWGGFIETALKKNDYQVKGITLSEAQQQFAKKRLGNHVNIALEDYRLQHKYKQKYDAIVSIEMLEAVGQSYWPSYFKILKSILKPKGKIMIQVIVIDDQLFDSYARGSDMIRTFIFPGGMLPSIKKLKEQLKNAQLKLVDTYLFGDHYAKTLTQWLETFKLKEKKLHQLGFDGQFQRMWQFYLSFCIAGFLKERINVVQMEITHA